MKLLICDDSQINIDLVLFLVDIFEKKYNVEFEKDTRLSGDFILTEKNSYDIAIVDVEMPGISGIELSQKLKEINIEYDIKLEDNFFDINKYQKIF